MEADMQASGPARADVSGKLALDRTRLAYERTMLSWVRTATALITFGFSIQQFFRITRADEPGAVRSTVPHMFGSLMVVTGLIALFLAVIEHRSAMASLRTQYPPFLGYPAPARSHARVLAAVIGLLGVAALVLMHMPVRT